VSSGSLGRLSSSVRQLEIAYNTALARYCNTSGRIVQTMKTTPYSESYKDDLVAILRQNVPKYFSEQDVADFQKYLSDRNWNGHDVFLDSDRRVVGCASYFVKSPSAVGLAWMFFAPSHIGSRRLLLELEQYIESVCVRVGASDLTVALNTTPRVAKLMARIGFAPVKTVKDGYGPGYDKVWMERIWLRRRANIAPRIANEHPRGQSVLPKS
jgi:hypothetical protein